MKLKTLTKNSFILVAVVFITLQVLISQFMIKRGFLRIEKQEVVENIRNAREALLNTLFHLDKVVHDWASWDDLYQFVQDHNTEFIASNLTKETFVNQTLAAIIIWDREHRVVYAKALTDKGEEDPTLLAQIFHAYDGAASQITGNQEIQNGFLSLNDDTLAFAIQRPILTSSDQGPSQGELLFVQLVTNETFEKLSKLFSFSFDIRLLSESPSTQDLQEILIKTVSDDQIDGITVLPDISGKPIAKLTVHVDRDIFEVGMGILRYYLVYISVLMIVLGWAVYFFLNKRVVKRITTFGDQLGAVRIGEEFQHRTNIPGQDEISELSSKANAMLDLIEQFHNNIDQQKRSIEKNNEFLEYLLNSISAGIFIIDPDSRKILLANTFALQLTGFSREEVEGKICHNFTCPRAINTCPVLDEHKEIAPGRHTLRGKNGEDIPVIKSTVFIEKDEQKVLLETFIDIRELNEAQKKLERVNEALEKSVAERTAYLQGIIDTSFIGIIVANDSGEIIEFSPSAERMTGYTRAEVLGRHFSFLLPELHATHLTEAMKNYLSGGTAAYLRQQQEMEGVRKDGTVFPMDFAATANHVEGQEIFVGMFSDITQRKRAEKNALENHRRYQKLVEDIGTQFVIFSHSPEGQILFASEGVQNVFGVSRQDALKKSWHDLKHWYPGEVDRITALVMQMIEQKSEFLQIEAKFEHPDGTLRYVAISEHPIWDQSGQLVSIDGLVEDVTERKAAALALAEAKEAAEQAARAKSEFLANMSHEIRTPMNAIIGLSYVALRGDLPPKQREFITKVNQSAENLLRILNDILDFSKIEAGKIEIDHVPLNINDVFERLIDVLREAAHNAGLELIFDIPSDLPSRLIGDPLRLGQILLNLASNAIKFTTEGEIILGSRIAKVSNGTCTLHFYVQDTGIGISADQQKALFKNFSQVDASITRRFGGTGLGLAISKKLVELMGGDIWVESELNEGSTFHFTATFKLEQKEAEETEKIDLSVYHLLLADNNQSVLRIFSENLSISGFRVVTADSFTSVVTELEQQSEKDQLDVVIMGSTLPAIDSGEFEQVIKNNLKIRHIPKIIILSDQEQDKFFEGNHAAKMIYDVLLKPIMYPTLLKTILEALGTKTRVEKQITIFPDDTRNIRTLLHGKKVLVVEDMNLNQFVVQECLDQVDVQTRIAENGLEALDHLQHEQFDAVLMDCQLPVMDGYIATMKIREEERFRDLPIIALTANVMQGDREKALAAGMSDHIGKPIDAKELYKVLIKWTAPGSIPMTGSVLQPFPQQIDEGMRMASLQGDVTEHEMALLERLQDLLREYDIEAIRLAEEIQQSPLMRTHSVPMTKIISAIKKYDFEKALTHLQEFSM